jgi:spermidine/putrescine transport system ATP-binding protein
VVALDGIDVDVPAGAFFTLLGPSGCGKTSLLRAIAGFDTPDSGRITLGGEPLDPLPPHRRPVNTVFQGYAVFPHMTVAENIAFGPRMQRLARAEIAARVARMLALVRLEPLAARRPDQLSGGQLQRVALARALAAQPRLLLLDEPLSALDLKLRTEMRAELKRLQSETGITFVLVTHDQHEALALSDRLAVMRAGRIEQTGTPAEIYDRPATRFVADFVGAANLIPATRIAPNRFAIPGGDLRATADAPPGAPPGAQVTLAIRPERASLGTEGLPGTIAAATYDGADTTLHIALPGGHILRLRQTNTAGAPPRHQAGETVNITIPPEAVIVLLE